MKHLSHLFFIAFLCMLTACTTINSSRQVTQTSANQPWGIVAFNNNTETPQAGNRATSITANVLRAKGVYNLSTFQPYGDCSQLVSCPSTSIPLRSVLAWAQKRNLCYVMTGSVNEWQYKVGLDGEPVAAVALQLYDVNSGRVIWSAVGSKIGNGRSGLGNVGQSLIDNMLKSLAVR